ncbi:DsbA family oxidoreductase [Actinoplanes sp. RD1]|uniref:DsbA family oxidoreductase n=1 Tax=Actinoplanes sp. RD1 TaxID=3064538 RepID=UPI00274286DF|nr:DsbA family oxidoreductase [Actinoplanes sp. RD1]
MTEPVVVDVWSDVVCPFCYLGHATLERAVRESAQAGQVEIRYHSFQLNPAFTGTAVSADDYVSNLHGVPKEQLDASHEHLTTRGAEAGLDYRFPQALMVNTLDAHRLIHFAKAHGQELAMVERLFRAEFTDGADLSDHAVLADLAASLGLDREAALEALRTKAYEGEIRADLDQARAYGITGVPFFVFDNKRAVSGAQPLELFQKALELSWQDRAAQPA